MRKYSRHFIAIICLTIVIVRLIFPNLNFDLISLSLVAIATLALLINKPDSIFEKTKKIKLGSFEWELQELNKETEKIEEKLSVKKKAVGLSGPARRNIQKESEFSSDYSTEILKLSINIEKTVREIYEFSFPEKNTKPLSVMKLIQELNDETVIDKETFEMLHKFWSLRNLAIHNHNYEISKHDYLSFTDIGLRILKILEAIKSNDSEGLPHYRLD